MNRISNAATTIAAFNYKELGKIASFIVCAYSIVTVVFSLFNVSETIPTAAKRIGFALHTASDNDLDPIEEEPIEEEEEEKFKTIESLPRLDLEDNWEKYSSEIVNIIKNSSEMNNDNKNC